MSHTKIYVAGLIDVIAQTLLIAVAFSSVAYVLAADLPVHHMVNYPALYLGLWQLLSSFLTSISGSIYRRLRAIHLFLSFAYLGAILFLPRIIDISITGLPVLEFLIYALPITLALYYYLITVKSWSVEQPQAAKKFVSKFHKILKVLKV